MSSMEKLNKTIYLSDIHNKEELKEELSKNILFFDKDEIMVKQSGMSKKVLDFFNNSQLTDNMICLLKNKKIDVIVYLLYMSDPNDIINTVNKIVEKHDINVNVIWKYISYEDDYEEHNINKDIFSEIILK